MAFDPADYHGKPLNDVLAEGTTRARSGHEALREAEAILALCAAQAMPMHQRGLVLQELWQVHRALGRVPVFMSQAGQDRYVFEQFFQDKRDGVFVDIGAFDGLLGSNSYFFEKSLGWRGLLVEASARWCERATGQRACPVVHAVIGAEDGEAEFLEVLAGYTQMSGLIDSYRPGVLDRVRAHSEHQERLTRVPVRTLDGLLAEHDLSHIDYCSIDVEGAERAILESLDFDRLDIQVMSLENGTTDPSRGYAQLLEPHGYRLQAVVGVDEIYCRRT